MPGLFGEWRKKHKIKEKNRELCERYPFLIPWNRFTGKFIKSYDYSFTELDSMEDGWRNAFGLKMCEEIRDALIEDDDLYRWRIVQMKEKYGVLCIYDNGHRPSSRIPYIIEKYEKLSRYICIKCGAKATRMTLGWISPFCDRCCPDQNYESIEQYWKEQEEWKTQSK